MQAGRPEPAQREARALAGATAALAAALMTAAPARAEAPAPAPAPGPAVPGPDLATAPGAAPSAAPTAAAGDPVAELGAGGRLRGDEAPGHIAFTFDDGPNPGTTEAVLDTLAAYDVPGAFFVVSKRLGRKHGEARRAVLARILADGHLVGSHSVRHADLATLDDEALAAEIDGSVATLTELTGAPIVLFRPPFGSLDPRGRRRLRQAGLTDVRWNLDPQDFFIPQPGELRAKTSALVSRSRGGILLLHDTKRATARALPGILDDLEARNCRHLAAGQALLVPVSLHYFLRDGDTPRPVPPAVAARTARYQAALPARCARRAAAEAEATPAAR
ncbi:MAG: polysaccharide deacetylase family protein [Kofleriaceae bacterium]|nr:polysaccharide deacetylase family protein [Kofleriaceae bacterium]MBP6842014.1 polysaccharide deacetylase family protein [Kofleriaceae bacterium]